MEVGTIKVFLTIAIMIFLEDAKVLGRGVGQMRTEKWGHGKGKIKGMKNPMEKLGGNVGGHLGNAWKAPKEVIHKGKLNGMKKLGGNMGDIPVHGSGYLGTAREASKVIYEGKFKGMRKLGSNAGGFPAYGAGLNVWRASEKVDQKGKLKERKKLGGNMGDVPEYGTGHLGNAGKAPTFINEDKLKGRKNLGGKFGGVPVNKAGHLGQFEGAATVLEGNGRMGKEQEWRRMRPGDKIHGAGHLANGLAVGHRGDALKAVQEVFHAPRYVSWFDLEYLSK